MESALTVPQSPLRLRNEPVEWTGFPGAGLTLYRHHLFNYPSPFCDLLSGNWKRFIFLVFSHDDINSACILVC